MAQDLLADGFVKLCIDPSLNVEGSGCKIVVEGQMGTSTAGIVADTLVHVTNTRDLTAQFGAGSVLAETLRKMFKQCPNSLDIYAIPRADPVGGVAAVYTSAITGPATADGIIDVFVADSDWSFEVSVTAGDTAATIAATIVAAAASEAPNLPWTPTVSGDNVLWTAKAGVIGNVGNFLTVEYGWTGRTARWPAGVAITTTQTTTGTGTLTAPDYDAILGTCCYSCFARLAADDAGRKAFNDYILDKWDCEKPQCFGHGYTYTSGSLGVVLADALNTPALSILAQSLSSKFIPWLQTGLYAALSCCSSCVNPELSIQGRTYGVLTEHRVPAGCTTGWSYDEQVQLQDAGFVVTGPLEGGIGFYTSPYVFNDVTNYLYDEDGRPNETFKSVVSRRLATATAISVAAQMQTYSGLAFFAGATQIREGTFGTNQRLMLADIRAWAKEQVGVLFSDFEDIDNDIQLKTDFQVAQKCKGKPGKLHLVLVYRPPVRIASIAASMKPKLLDNCSR